MQTVLITADEARKVYLENKSKYAKFKLRATENTVYSTIEKSINDNMAQFGVLLDNSIFPDVSTRNYIENQLRDLGYKVDFKPESTYISWAIFDVAPAVIEAVTEHRCFKPASEIYRFCVESLYQMDIIEKNNILDEIYFTIKQELETGFCGKKVSICVNKQHIEYIYKVLIDKKYEVKYKIVNEKLVRLIIKW
ncbi:Hypothetical protein PACV_288 [Pacmanvirus A23]|uniref:Hypothetical protein n=1 Tax=Pacmanvirus A23 TaxID=1932881 RepID=UPI000A091B5B|nr:Hypothetical protein B9W72_gp284 [Pacmanvirus A23]SIP86001.1 Hypothetical protein PACV_288 [Pacmanvirus A23]